jgi:hypothetical protein
MKDIDNENSLKYKLMTNIKERAYRRIKEAFEKNDIKRKYFLIWKLLIGEIIKKSTKKHRKSITKVKVIKRKDKPELIKEDENKKENKEIKNKEEEKKEEEDKQGDLKQKDEEEDKNNEEPNNSEFIELYNDVISLFRKGDMAKKKQSKKKILDIIHKIKDEEVEEENKQKEEDKKEDDKHEDEPINKD